MNRVMDDEIYDVWICFGYVMCRYWSVWYDMVRWMEYEQYINGYILDEVMDVKGVDNHIWIVVNGWKATVHQMEYETILMDISWMK